MPLVTTREPGGGNADIGCRIRRHLLIQTLPILAVGSLIWANRQVLARLDLTAITAGIAAIGPANWLAAAVFTVGSFWAIGQYDVTLHRHFCTRIAPERARVAGMTAVALGQALGLAPIIGTLVRSRMLPELAATDVVRLSAGVALSFLAGWTVVAAVAILLLAEGTAADRFTFPAAALLFLACIGMLTLFRRSAAQASLGPDVLTLCRIAVFVTIDTLCAALVLWFLLPPGTGISPAQIIPAYLLALGAGLVLSTPGGIGAFEAALIALLPGLPDEPLLGAILAYRIVYVALPAVVAVFALCCGRKSGRAQKASALLSPAEARQNGLAARAAGGRRAEPLVIRQGEHGAMMDADGAFWVTATRPSLLIALDDPTPIRSPSALERSIRLLDDEANATARIICLYKCGSRAAAAARRAGYRVMPVAAEAALDPASFAMGGPEHAQLRRKLRRAARAGVLATPAGPNLPLSAMAEIARSWSLSHGGERGFSMGRFDPAYVAGQQVFLAHANGCLVAFATFHAAAGEWTLDLMRHGRDAPDGTMHALIVAAAGAAQAHRIPRLSLAGMPLPADMIRSPVLRTINALGTRMSGQGLARFKTSFAPRLTPRYIAAPSRLALIFAVIGIAQAVRRPPPLIPLTDDVRQSMPADRTFVRTAAGPHPAAPAPPSLAA